MTDETPTDLIPAPSTELVPFDPYSFTPRQTLLLIAHASNPLLPLTIACRVYGELRQGKALPTHTCYEWRRKSPRFKYAHDAIRANPIVAANFLLAWSQTDAVRTLRKNLGEGARVSTDAARALMLEAREKGQAAGTRRLADLVEAALRAKV